MLYQVYYWKHHDNPELNKKFMNVLDSLSKNYYEDEIYIYFTLEVKRPNEKFKTAFKKLHYELFSTINSKYDINYTDKEKIIILWPGFRFTNTLRILFI